MITVLVMAFAQADPAPKAPVVEVPAGYSTTIWAEHPLVLDPVAFCFDEQGRAYLAETERQERGVEDNRGSPFWLLDDLASQTIDDRRAMYEKWAHKREGGMDYYREWSDRVVMLRDTDSDGVADARTVFAGPFNDPLDGTGAGLLALDGDVWFTNIPHLWMLRDTDDDGVADEQSTVHSGFGVRIALRGHDMHGLVLGPDGRLYWSIGDRGYTVTRADGTVLSDPHSGAVFRCELDGSELEVFHEGLRNPQELAFDKYGYLFTGDNNSDSEDRARMVYVAQGGRTGWDMAYQTLVGDNERGPWVQEGLWKTAHEGRPAWVLPPLAHVGNGPSGVTMLPGTGQDERRDETFLMTNFTGTPASSGVFSMRMVPDGAGFSVEDPHQFIKGVLCTDVEVGWDGAVYVSDWVKGWGSSDTGRIYRVQHDELIQHGDVTSAEALVREGITGMRVPRLTELLAHPDQRIRLRAQYALAGHGTEAIEPLAQAIDGSNQMARIHAIWGLGMVHRLHDGGDAAMAPVIEALWDDDPEIRAQAARVVGDVRANQATEDLLGLAFDESPRVVYHAVMGLGRTGDADAIDAITEVLWSNEDADPWIRHACAHALAEIGDGERLVQLLGDPQPSIRLGALLALRYMADEGVAMALRDPDAFIAAEAARAVHDAEIDQAMPALAALADGLVVEDTREGRSIGRRVIEAALRGGGAQEAAHVARMAADDANPPIIRLEAARALAEWIEPGMRDRVTGRFRDLDTRDATAIGPAAAPWLPALAGASGELGEQARVAADALGVRMDPMAQLEVVQDDTRADATRVDCLRRLADQEELGARTIEYALGSDRPALRAAAMTSIPDADRAVTLAEAALTAGTLVEQRAAIEILGRHGHVDRLAQVQDEIISARRSPDMALDVMLAMSSDDPPGAAHWMAAMHGGDTARGEWLVRHHAEASCMRCHSIDGLGGTAGPVFDGVAVRLDRGALLESIIAPQRVVAEGYGATSAMPEMTQTLTPHEVRDMVAYLATLDEATP